MARRRRDRGSILVLALLVSASAAVLGMWMVASQDLGVRKVRYLARSAEARRIGDSGIELARGRLGENASWGGSSVANPAYPTHTLVVTVTPLVYHTATVQSVGAVSDTTATVKAELRAVAHEVLHYNAYSTKDVTFDNATVGGYVRANGKVVVDGEIDFLGVVETIDGESVDNKIDSNQVLLKPDAITGPSGVVSAYAAMASSLTSVPRDGNDYVLESVYLSSTNNPFGGTNPDGVYVLDAEGEDVWIRDVYVEGTLILQDAKTVTIERGFYHRRAREHLATLLVEGDVDMNLETTIGESDLGVDLDGDGTVELDAEFGPGVDGGIILVTGVFKGPRGGFIRGCVVADDLQLIGKFDLIDDSDLSEYPVVAFQEEGAWQVVPGSIIGG